MQAMECHAGSNGSHNSSRCMSLGDELILHVLRNFQTSDFTEPKKTQSDTATFFSCSGIVKN